MGGCRALVVAVRAKGRGKQGKQDECEYIEVSEDGSDSWRLDTAVDLLQRGGVGVIPTDTMYALVCDINNATAVDALYRCVPLHSVVGGISSGAPLAQPWAGFAQHQGYESQKAAQHPLPRLL